MKNEPVLTLAGITAVVAALIGVLVAFGVPMTDDQQKAVLVAVGAIAPLALAYYARKRVTPVAADPDPVELDGGR